MRTIGGQVLDKWWLRKTFYIHAYANMLILEEHRTNLLTSVETISLRNYVVVALFSDRGNP